MVNKNAKTWSGCPVRFGMGHFGDKWSLLIIRDLMFKGRHYYNEFLDAGEGISTNILASRLADLEENGIIAKRTDDLKKSKKFYFLTEKGIALMPMMLAMIEWAAEFDGQTEVPEEFIKKLRESPEQLKQELLDALRQY